MHPLNVPFMHPSHILPDTERMLDLTCEQIIRMGWAPHAMAITNFHSKRDYEQVFADCDVTTHAAFRSSLDRLVDDMRRHRLNVMLHTISYHDLLAYCVANQVPMGPSALPQYLAWQAHCSPVDCCMLQCPPPPPTAFAILEDRIFTMRMRIPALLCELRIIEHPKQPTEVVIKPYVFDEGVRQSDCAPIEVMHSMAMQTVDYLHDIKKLKLKGPARQIVVTPDLSPSNPVVPEHLYLENKTEIPSFAVILSLETPQVLATPRMDGKPGIIKVQWLDEEMPDAETARPTIEAATAFHEMLITGDLR